ncbi:hypothetical protein ACSBR2_026110 [Camellia fascicularis]
MKVDGESKRFHSLIWASFGSSPDPKFWLGICILPIWPFGDSLKSSPSTGPQSVSGKKSWNNSLQELGGSIKFGCIDISYAVPQVADSTNAGKSPVY